MGASEPQIFEAKASAGGSVVLPASKPLSAAKFIFNTARAIPPTTNKGTKVMNNPLTNQSKPTELNTIEKNFAPASNPTAAKNMAMPNSRNARFTFAGMCHTNLHPIRILVTDGNQKCTA